MRADELQDWDLLRRIAGSPDSIHKKHSPWQIPLKLKNVPVKTTNSAPTTLRFARSFAPQ